MGNKAKTILIFSLIILLSIVSTVMLFNIRENAELKKELNSSKNYTDSLQHNFLSKNKELIAIINLVQHQKDSIGKKSASEGTSIDGVLIGNKPVSLDEFINIANKYMHENFMLKNKSRVDSFSIERYKRIIAQLDRDKVIEQDEKGSISYRKMSVIDSNINSLEADIKKLKFEVASKNTLLKLIRDNYGIETQVEDKKDSYTARLLNTTKLDSALLLFPYFKHKIKTNKKGETIIRY